MYLRSINNLFAVYFGFNSTTKDILLKADEDPSSPSKNFTPSKIKSNIIVRMNVLRSTPLLGRRSKLNSLKSCDSTESSNSGGLLGEYLLYCSKYKVCRVFSKLI